MSDFRLYAASLNETTNVMTLTFIEQGTNPMFIPTKWATVEVPDAVVTPI
jgi:hypothetical protein